MSQTPMGDLPALRHRAQEMAAPLARLAKENRNVLLLTHLDADGLTAAGILAQALQRKGGRYLIRVVGDLTPTLLPQLAQAGFDTYLFCEIGGSHTPLFPQHFGDRWLLLDHHYAAAPDLAAPQVLNAAQFGFDGTRDISGAGMAYLVARELDPANLDLAWLALVGALADRQDQAAEHRLTSVNRTILEEAVQVGRVSVTRDLVFYGRETKPLHEAVAATTTPFLPGLSGSKDTCLATLTAAGLTLHVNGRWRSLAELNEAEKRLLLQTLIPYLDPANPTAVDELVGDVYTLTREDEYTPLRDAREFATLLNACGRMGHPGVGLALCLGDRDQALRDGERLLAEYRATLHRYLQTLLGEEDRVLTRDALIVVRGEGVVAEDMLGAVASILSGLPRFASKLLLVHTGADDAVKCSARRGRAYGPPVNLGRLMAETAGSCGGQGGGHVVAAGARVPATHWPAFMRAVQEGVAASAAS